MDPEDEARIDAVLARARRWEAVSDAIDARRMREEEDGESWIENWERAALLETIKWSEGVIAQVDRVLGVSDPTDYDVDLVIVVLNLLRNAIRHYVKVVGEPAVDRLVPLVDRLDVVAPHVAQARHAIEHADEWNAGTGRTQPRTPLISRSGTYRHFHDGVIEAPFVAERATSGGNVEDEMAWLFPETATIPVRVVQKLAQEIQAEAVNASTRFTTSLRAQNADYDPDEEDFYTDVDE